MEQIISIIFFIVIFIVGKILESSFKKSQPAPKKKPYGNLPSHRNDKPVPRETNPEPVTIENNNTQSQSQKKDPIEELLRQLGMLPPKPEPEQLEDKPAEIKAQPKSQQPEPVLTIEPVTAPQPIPKEQPDDVGLYFNHNASAYHTEDKINLKQKESSEASPRNEALYQLAMDKQALKNAFIMNEILQPPLCSRKLRKFK